MNNLLTQQHEGGQTRPPSGDGVTEQYLMFSLGTDTFATRIQPIREIIEYPGMTEVPLTPGFMRGVINLRGAVVPVVDLSVRFGRSSTNIGRRTCIVIVEAQLEEGNHLVGVIVDGVTEVLEIEPEKVENRPNFGVGLRTDFIAGMINKNEQFVVALDMDKILSSQELEQLIQVEQNAGSVTAGQSGMLQ
jgi:purine-binding chemotaxis protein CheW